MHKGIILLTKAGDKAEALSKVDEFMEGYGDGQVWDWFVIGGRWTGVLDKYEPSEDRKNYEKCNLCNGTGFRNDSIGKDSRKKESSYTCNGCGHFNDETKKWEHGKFGPGIKRKWHNAPRDNNCMLLSECIDVVREWAQDPGQAYKEQVEEAEKNWGKDGGRPDRKMYGYCLEKAAKHLQQDFHFDVNVYNSETYDYSVPEDLSGWFAVMVDMHN